jgi:hypothetical protein
MATFERFPEDGKLWLVKWIDKVQLPHLSTRSAAIDVLLQKLPFDDPAKISRLKEREIQAILNVSAYKHPELFLNPCRKVLVGAVPALSIGAVFKDTHKVGELPTLRAPLLLEKAESSCQVNTLYDEIPAPDGWDPKFPHRILNPSEFSLPKQSFPLSQCLSLRTKKCIYVIPRSVIFQTFYALHPSLARAFTNGPWPETRKSLIYLGDLDSGMKTEIDRETGRWNLVRQLGVRKELAPLLALYSFDPYARVCAESIYSSALQERGAGGSNPWHINAKIPFPGTEPVMLEVRAFRLRNSGAAGSPSKILITRIVMSSFPKEVRELSTAAYINSTQGAERIEVDEPPPFGGGALPPKPPSAATTIASDVDARPNAQPVEIVMDTFRWLNPPEISMLEKASSKTYVGQPRPPRPTDPGGDATSPGNLGYTQGNLPEAQVQTELVRDPERRFVYLQQALRTLVESNEIAGYRIVAPTEPTQTIMHSGDPCWNFLDDDARQSGDWPKTGWRLIKRGKAFEDGTYTLGQPRAALVVEIEYKDVVGYWIEIECKGSGFTSPFIFNIGDNDPLVVIPHCLEIIAKSSGVNLKNPLEKGLAELPGRSALVQIYTHQHESPTSGAFNVPSILRLFKRIK